jgi:hypothetical protein
MDQLEAQNELLGEFAKRAADKDEEHSAPGALTAEQRAEIEGRFGKDSISAAIDPGRGRGGRAPGAILVRLHDGRLISVYDRRGHARSARSARAEAHAAAAAAADPPDACRVGAL